MVHLFLKKKQNKKKTGGTKKYVECFFNQEFKLKCSHKEREKLPVLRDVLENHLQVIQSSLFVHHMYCTENLFNLESSMATQFLDLKEQIMNHIMSFF